MADELSEIEALLASVNKSNKASAYSTLLHLQERWGEDESAIGLLARRSQSLLGSMIGDVFDEDEEVAAQACKCLGFMIYHPSVVSSISDDTAGSILKSLAKLIINTRIKSVCNLGVWCISIQQFSVSSLSAYFECLLMAVVHALDNPLGSLSTTYEAIQAIIKLDSVFGERMKESSNIWAPPIYRRLISAVKKERDISERCLLKLKSTITPPIQSLAKVVVIDMKKRLLPRLKELEKQGLKIQAVQAWGCFISLIGSHAMQNRQLLNEMLRFLEQAFSDRNPQVQIASFGAWERMIDAFLNHPIQACDVCILCNGDKEFTVRQETHGTQANGFSKRIKLIMTPILEIISSRCDASVHSACIKTWCYLLYKLGSYVNCLAIVKSTFEPILKAVFNMRPDNRTDWLWNICIDILDDSISAKYAVGDPLSVDRIKPLRNSSSAECLWKQYPVGWLPWRTTRLEFYLDMVQVLSYQGLLPDVSPEHRSLVANLITRIFRSIMQGVQVELKHAASNYDQILWCLNIISRFIKNLFEDAHSEDSGTEKLELLLPLIETATESLEPSILGSTFYKVTLDLKCVKRLSVNKGRGTNALAFYNKSLMEMGSPIVHLMAIYLSVITKLISLPAKSEFISLKFHCYLKHVLSSATYRGAFHGILSLLYCDSDLWQLDIWMVVAAAMKDMLVGATDLSLLKSEYDRTGFSSACRFLTYPLFICSLPQIESSHRNYNKDLNLCIAPMFNRTDLDQVTEAWKSTFNLVMCASKIDLAAPGCFVENLCSVISNHLWGNIGNCEFGSFDIDQASNLQYLLGEVAICALDQITSDIKTVRENDDLKGSIDFKETLTLASRFIQMTYSVREMDQSAAHDVTIRVFFALSCFTSCLYLRRDIILLIEALHDPLLHCLTRIETWNEGLHFLWSEILSSLQIAQPSFAFNSTFLKSQAKLLEKTMDHPNPSISEPTIKYWNATYGKQLRLDYPQCLLFVVDKLSRNGKISLFKHSAGILQNCNAARQKYNLVEGCKVTVTSNMTSKRVELTEQTAGQCCNTSSFKRKRLELTKHRIEARRAQQGKERDGNGHGPGVGTSTSRDFSQTNDDSQEPEDIRNTEAILELLKRP